MNLPVLGFRINKFAYITDMNYISAQERKKMRGLDVLVINALRRKKHVSHFSLDEALDVIEDVKPSKAYLTHISHKIGFYKDVAKELPANVFLSYDGLIIKISDKN